ncbi:MAG: NAD(P)H-dependent glycerol-3-phosphate dehydrogenase, partial [Frankiaceae bacterium]
PLSRNRTLGVEIARGRTAAEITKEWRVVVEGIRAARAARQLAAEFGVDAPIFREVNAVVNEGRTADEAFRGLREIQPATEDKAG